jgi:hypothetical protein
MVKFKIKKTKMLSCHKINKNNKKFLCKNKHNVKKTVIY